MRPMLLASLCQLMACYDFTLPKDEGAGAGGNVATGGGGATTGSGGDAGGGLGGMMSYPPPCQQYACSGCVGCVVQKYDGSVEACEAYDACAAGCAGNLACETACSSGNLPGQLMRSYLQECAMPYGGTPPCS